MYIEDLQTLWEDSKNNTCLAILFEDENWLALDLWSGTLKNPGEPISVIKINMKTGEVLVNKELHEISKVQS